MGVDDKPSASIGQEMSALRRSWYLAQKKKKKPSSGNAQRKTTSKPSSGNAQRKYTVKKGEDILAVANKFKTSANAILNYSTNKGIKKLSTGTVLRIPQSGNARRNYTSLQPAMPGYFSPTMTAPTGYNVSALPQARNPQPSFTSAIAGIGRTLGNIGRDLSKPRALPFPMGPTAAWTPPPGTNPARVAALTGAGGTQTRPLSTVFGAPGAQATATGQLATQQIPLGSNKPGWYSTRVWMNTEYVTRTLDKGEMPIYMLPETVKELGIDEKMLEDSGYTFNEDVNLWISPEFMKADISQPDFSGGGGGGGGESYGYGGWSGFGGGGGGGGGWGGGGGGGGWPAETPNPWVNPFGLVSWRI